MIVVLASRYDELARELVSQWEAQGAALLTCGDLSTAGWCHYVGSPGLSTAVIAGRRVAAGEITGESYVSYLRRKVDTTEPRLLHTIRGVGYVLRVPRS